MTRDFHEQFVKAMKMILIFSDEDLVLLFKDFNAKSNNVAEFMDIVIKYASMSVIDCLDYKNKLKAEK